MSWLLDGTSSAIGWARTRRSTAAAVFLGATTTGPAAAQDSGFHWQAIGWTGEARFIEGTPRWIDPACQVWSFEGGPTAGPCTDLEVGGFSEDGTAWIRGTTEPGGATATWVMPLEGDPFLPPANAREWIVGTDGRIAYLDDEHRLFIQNRGEAAVGPLIREGDWVGSLGGQAHDVVLVGMANDGRAWLSIQSSVPFENGIFVADEDGVRPVLTPDGAEAGIELSSFGFTSFDGNLGVVSARPASGGPESLVVVGDGEPYVAVTTGETFTYPSAPSPGEYSATTTVRLDGDRLWIKTYDGTHVSDGHLLLREGRDPPEWIRTFTTWTFRTAAWPFYWGMQDNRLSRYDVRSGARLDAASGPIEVHANGAPVSISAITARSVVGAPDGSMIVEVVYSGPVQTLRATLAWTDAPFEPTRTSFVGTATSRLRLDEDQRPVLVVELGLENTGKARFERFEVDGLPAQGAACAPCEILTRLEPGQAETSTIEVPVGTWDVAPPRDVAVTGRSSHGPLFDVTQILPMSDPVLDAEILDVRASIPDPATPNVARFAVSNLSDAPLGDVVLALGMPDGTITGLSGPGCEPGAGGEARCDLNLAALGSIDVDVTVDVPGPTTLTGVATALLGARAESTVDVTPSAIEDHESGCGCVSSRDPVVGMAVPALIAAIRRRRRAR
jgi:hypothetical protein